MNEEFDKYHSIPFNEYFISKGGSNVGIDHEKRFLNILDSNSNLIKRVHFSTSINHDFDLNDLLNKTVDEKGKAYFVYENGVKGYDWLWHYGDLIPIAELFK